MKLNFKKFYTAGNIDEKLTAFVGLSCAETANCKELILFFETELKRLDMSDDEVNEAKDVSTVMGVANNYYRFRHYVEKEAYKKPAGFRMSAMAKPTVGKLGFELASLSVSILNGCEACVQGHERAVLEHGGNEEQVHDAAKLASTINGLAVVFRQLAG